MSDQTIKTIKGRLDKIGQYPNSWKLEYQSSKGGWKEHRHSQQFSNSVHSSDSRKLDVIFERQNGAAINVRLPIESISVFEIRSKNENAKVNRMTKGAAPKGGPRPKGDFHNPYNFIPAPEPKDAALEGLLGQHAPAGHDKYHDDLWSGRIGIKITTKTPLLIPDAANVTEANDHKTFPVRVVDGKPYLSPTSLKGALRSSYEAITNSRMGVLGKNLVEGKINRNKWTFKPHSLLSDSLLPASFYDELSPADRVFGWVSQDQKGNGRFKGQLRPGPINYVKGREDAIEVFNNNDLPLAILSTPKPQQARFYVAKDQSGTAQDNGISKQNAGYNDNKGLRGRKVFPHHAWSFNEDNYWNGPASFEASKLKAPPTLNEDSKNYREFIRYRGKNGNRTEQNRSIEGWVKPGTEFTTSFEVINLNRAELGALLWLISQPKGRFHRLGGGKPLGFGSVFIEITELELANGKGRKKQFASLTPIKNKDSDFVTSVENKSTFIADYKKELEIAYELQFEKISFIRAFKQSASGCDKPTHYPRGAKRLSADEENFRWFVQNEKKEKLALPNLDGGTELPYYK